jgi:hypothetical protein
MFFYEQSFEGGELVNNLVPNFCTNVDIKGVRE